MSMIQQTNVLSHQWWFLDLQLTYAWIDVNVPEYENAPKNNERMTEPINKDESRLIMGWPYLSTVLAYENLSYITPPS